MVYQVVTTRDRIVRIIAIAPIILALGSFENKYLNPGTSPKGGSKALTRYKDICLEIVVTGGGFFIFLPQLGQK
jgi:hypothetical protein